MSAVENNQPKMLDDEDTISLLDLLLVLARHKKLLILLPLVFAALGVIYALVVTPVFDAKTVLMPPQQQQSSAAAMLAQLGGLAGAAGGALGVKNPNDMYLGMLQSRVVGEAMANQFKLVARYQSETLTDALKTLDQRSTMESGKDGLITISVEDESPVVAAKMANAYVEELRKLTNSLAITESQQRRKFFEEQLREAKNALADAEVAMKSLQEKTGVLEVDAQSKATIEALAELRGQIAAKQVELSAMSTFATGQNPDYQRTQSEMTSLKAQLAQLSHGKEEADGAFIVKSKVPSLGLDYVRKLRDVKYYETLFEIVAKQYEIARMDEAKEGGIIQVIDPAVPPEKKSKPKRVLIVLMALVLGLFFAILLAFVTEALKNAAQGPDGEKLRELRAALRFRSTKTA